VPEDADVELGDMTDGGAHLSGPPPQRRGLSAWP
jgi:hypothetical protein